MDDTYQFTYDGATITLARRTNRHAMQIDRIVVALSEGDEDGASLSYKRLYAKMVAQTDDVIPPGEDKGDGMPLDLPSPLASPDELRAGFEAFMAADGNLGDSYYTALNTVNAPPGPRALLPASELDEAERKKTRRAANSGAPNDASSSGDSPAAATNPA